MLFAILRQSNNRALPICSDVIKAYYIIFLGVFFYGFVVDPDF